MAFSGGVRPVGDITSVFFLLVEDGVDLARSGFEAEAASNFALKCDSSLFFAAGDFSSSELRRPFCQLSYDDHDLCRFHCNPNHCD